MDATKVHQTFLAANNTHLLIFAYMYHNDDFIISNINLITYNIATKEINLKYLPIKHTRIIK